MKLTIISVGDVKKGPEKDLLTDYVDRFRKTGRQIGLRSLDLISVSAGPDRDAEASRLLEKIPKGAKVLRLDERGEALTSEGFAARLGRWRDQGEQDLVFLISGAAGYGRGIADSVPDCLALGPQTWPHRLVKIMLSEQLYRAATLLAGLPYHKA